MTTNRRLLAEQYPDQFDPTKDNFYTLEGYKPKLPSADEYCCPRVYRSPFLTNDGNITGLPPTLHFFSWPNKYHAELKFNELPHHKIKRRPKTTTPVRIPKKHSAPWKTKSPEWDRSHNITFSRCNSDFGAPLREYFPRRPIAPKASERLHDESFNPLGHLTPSMFQEPIADPLPEPKFRSDLNAHYDRKHFGVTYDLKTREETGGEMYSKITNKRVDWNNQWHLKEEDHRIWARRMAKTFLPGTVTPSYIPPMMLEARELQSRGMTPKRSPVKK